MKHHIQFKWSHSIWSPGCMKGLIDYAASEDGFKPKKYAPYIIEWWLHNIGYWITKPLTFMPAIKKINLRCRDVDLMVEEGESE